MAKPIPNPPTPLTIERLGRIAYAEASSREVPMEIMQAMPTLIYLPETADYPLIAYTYHVLFKRPVGFALSETMWVNYIDPYTGEIVRSGFSDESFFPDSPGIGVFYGLKFEGFSLQGSVEQQLFKAIDDPVWRAGFNRLLNDPAVMSDSQYFSTIPANPSPEIMDFCFAYWRQLVTYDTMSGLNYKMFLWVRGILDEHHPQYPGIKSDPLTGRPLERRPPSPQPVAP